MGNLDMEHDYTVLEQLICISERLKESMKLKEREENIMLEKGKEMQQAMFEWNEAQMKYRSLTVKEKEILDLIDNLRLDSSSRGDKKQELLTGSDSPYLNGRDIMSSVQGITFQPTDEEILSHLKEKISNPCQTSSGRFIKDCANFQKLDPWDLPGADSIKEGKALYFYVQKKVNSERRGPNGFWRAGNRKTISETGSEIGHRRMLKYFEYIDEKNGKLSKPGRPKPTNWIMHEYELDSANSQSQEKSSLHCTICKITSTGRNIKVRNDISREGSIGPSEMVVEQNSSLPAQNYLDNNDLGMHIQNEGDLNVHTTVDSKQDETKFQAIYNSVADKIERSIQEKVSGFWEQMRNGEIEPSEEVTPGYTSGIHSTPSMMVTTHEAETGGVEPQQFENPRINSEEFGPTSIPGQTSESCVDHFPNPNFTEMEFESEPWIDLMAGLTGMEDENQSRFDHLSNTDIIGTGPENFSVQINSSDDIEFIYV